VGTESIAAPQILTTVSAGGNAGYVDTSVGVTTSAMSTQSTNAAVPITGMTWTVANSKNYLLDCHIPITFTSTATLAFSLGNTGGAATSYSLDAQGLLGAATTFGEINTLAQTAFATKTSTSGAVAGTTVAHVWAEIQGGASMAGTLTLSTWNVAAAGTIQVLANAVCRLTQEN
jgi:hypothetical protein